MKFLRNVGEVALVLVLLLLAAVTSPLWLAWLCWSWWRQLRALEREQQRERLRVEAMSMREYVSSGAFERDWRSAIDDAQASGTRFYTRTHSLPDDPA